MIDSDPNDIESLNKRCHKESKNFK